MRFRFEIRALTKRIPLSISRGTSTGSNNLYVFVQDGPHEGVGECAPGTGFDLTLAALAERQLQDLVDSDLKGLSITEVVARARSMGVDAPALAAIDVALWDLFAKKCGQPLYRLFGLHKPLVPTSVTIGINPPEVTRERVPEILARTHGKKLKIKLGSPDGIEADQAHYEAAREAAARFRVGLQVDANGGWSLTDAKTMVAWLSERGCDYIEQPLVKGAEAELPELFKSRKLPIFLDESVHVARDVPKLADRCDGVNLKLMKTGGLTEAMRLISTARACGLQTMIGCMGESSIAIAAGAALGACFDHIDLDSHLNLNPDPATGLKFVTGVVMPSDAPGHGASLLPA